MPSAEILLPFLLASLLFAALPGPALVYTAAQTLAHGRRGGLAAALGLHLGGCVHVVAAAAGLSAVFSHSPTLYTALRLAGAVYLVWLGIGILRGRADPAPHAAGAPARTAWRSLLHSMSVEVLNPKTAMFFIAFLPQFVDPAAAWPVWVQLLVLGAIVNGFASAADVVAVLAAARLLDAARRSQRLVRLARTVGGSLLVGLGAHLALSRN